MRKKIIACFSVLAVFCSFFCFNAFAVESQILRTLNWQNVTFSNPSMFTFNPKKGSFDTPSCTIGFRVDQKYSEGVDGSVVGTFTNGNGSVSGSVSNDTQTNDFNSAQDKNRYKNALNTLSFTGSFNKSNTIYYVMNFDVTLPYQAGRQDYQMFVNSAYTDGSTVKFVSDSAYTYVRYVLDGKTTSGSVELTPSKGLRFRINDCPGGITLRFSVPVVYGGSGTFKAFSIYFQDCVVTGHSDSASAIENEKQEAQEGGASAKNDSDEAMPNDSASLTDSLSSLTSALSYSGTDSAWTFPAISLPAISGVMEETSLTEPQSIDFGGWVNSIPSDVLTLIRALGTIALIIFCFKELYDTISYVLTMRKDDSGGDT